MAYSMFERPKLHNVRSMKFYPEEYDHHVSFRHKTLSPDFDLSYTNATSYSVEAHASAHRKCPIYVHTVHKIHHQNDGDFLPKSDKKKTKNKHKTTLEKLEESYWANWKPDKKNSKKIAELAAPPEIQIIKSAPERRRKIKVYPREVRVESEFGIEKNPSRSQEIQTDDLPPPPEDNEKDDAISVRDSHEQSNDDKEKGEKNSTEEVVDTKFLKHTDSLILNVKKQKEEKEHFEQPKCIRLYRKPGKLTSKNYIKGGSYPLKSCLKKESNFAKASTKLARPGSPIIISSNYSNKHAKSHRR